MLKKALHDEPFSFPTRENWQDSANHLVAALRGVRPVPAALDVHHVDQAGQPNADNDLYLHSDPENYATVLHSDYMQFFFNNLIVSVAAVLVSLVVGVPAAYALARYQFKGKEDIAFTILSSDLHRRSW